MRMYPFSNLRRGIVAATLGMALAFAPQARAEEKLPPGAKLVRIEAQPPAVHLKHAFDYSQLVFTGVLDSGERLDVTRMVKGEAPVAAVTVSPTGLVRPVADGAGEFTFTLAGQSV